MAPTWPMEPALELKYLVLLSTAQEISATKTRKLWKQMMKLYH